jgi:hypothetical protein
MACRATGAASVSHLRDRSFGAPRGLHRRLLAAPRSLMELGRLGLLGGELAFALRQRELPRQRAPDRIIRTQTTHIGKRTMRRLPVGRAW